MATYSIDSAGDVALSASTAKTVLSVIAGTGAPIKLVEFGVSFDGTSSTATPVLVELCASTEAGAGTATLQSPVQVGGPTRTVQAAGKRAFSAEPTVLTTLKRWRVHPQAGLVLQFPLGREPQQVTGGRALVLRCTPGATGVNAAAYLEFEEG